MAHTRRLLAVVTAAGLIAGSMLWSAARAKQDEDDHSDNFKQKTRLPIVIDKKSELHAQGSDLAFKGKFLYAGSYQGPSVWKILKRKPFIKQLGFLPCEGGQGDISVLGNYLFVSVDSPRVGPTCKPEDSAAAGQNVHVAGQAWEGLRIIDISNPKRPKEAGSVDMPCGSHTHTLLPGETKSYIYIESYPLGAQGQDCSVATHRKVQIVEVPNSDPTKAKLLDKTIDVSPVIGCHDITTFPQKGIMFGACINQSFIWDISKDPTAPELLSTIENPEVQVHHSTAMTWDGKYLVLGDEHAGAAGGGCVGDEESTVGAAWFYDITDPTNPVLVGHHSLPRTPPPADDEREAEAFRCTNHNFNVIPMKDPKKYLLAVSYYAGGIAVVDFSDPSDPTEVGHYLHQPEGINPDTWSSYWYNGRIYTNDYSSRLGIGVYRFKGTAGRRKTHFFGKTSLNPKGEMNPQVQITNW